jgi:hypothetical protein
VSLPSLAAFETTRVQTLPQDSEKVVCAGPNDQFLPLAPDFGAVPPVSTQGTDGHRVSLLVSAR